MPMNRSLYPKNWNAIARQIKSAADWTCQNCDRPCRKPDEDWQSLALRAMSEGWGQDLWEEEEDEEFGFYEGNKFGRFVLTVAHLDHNPANNDPSNLKALCSVCHLRHDAPHHANSRRANRKRKLEQAGQLRLLDL